jgi:hypothetical protein
VTEAGERAGKDEPQWRRDGRARAPAEQGRLKEVISADYDLLSTSALHLQEVGGGGGTMPLARIGDRAWHGSNTRLDNAGAMEQMGYHVTYA